MAQQKIGETYKCTLDEKTLEKAKEELFEDPAQRQSHIQTLREWVEQQPHLKSRTDDAFLLRFLRVAKFSQTRARKQLDHYLTIRCGPDTGSWFRSDSKFSDKDRELSKLGTHLLLPGSDQHGRRIFMIRTGAYDPQTVDFGEVFKIGFDISEALLADDEASQVHGVVALLDFTGFSFSHASSFTPSFIKKCSSTWQDCIPFRQKAIHYYNTPMIFNGIFEIIKFFMKEKIKNRIQFHYEDKDSLAKQIPKECLPDYLGGTAGTIEDIIAYNEALLKRNASQFDLFELCSVDESKRPKGGTAETNALGGISGSFRKLAVD